MTKKSYGTDDRFQVVHYRTTPISRLNPLKHYCAVVARNGDGLMWRAVLWPALQRVDLEPCCPRARKITSLNDIERLVRKHYGASAPYRTKRPHEASCPAAAATDAA